MHQDNDLIDDPMRPAFLIFLIDSIGVRLVFECGKDLNPGMEEVVTFQNYDIHSR